MTETWYVLEDGTVGDPREISRDKNDVLRHKDGRAVAYGPHGPKSRGCVDAEAERAKASGASPPPPANGGAETDATRDAVEIPAEWRDLPWPDLASLASRVSPTPIKNKAGAVAAIDAALARRAAAAGAP